MNKEIEEKRKKIIVLMNNIMYTKSIVIKKQGGF